MDATFPDIERVIPSAWQGSVAVDRIALMKSVERLNGFDREDDTRRVIKCSAGKRALILSGGSLGGEGEESVAAEIDGDCEPVGLNPRYLHAALASMSGARVTLRLSGPSGPVRLEDEASPEDVHIIMPKRI